MKKSFILIAAITFFLCSRFSFAQQSETAVYKDLHPGSDAVPGLINHVNQQVSPSKATWDVLFSHNITAVTNSVGCAGICYIDGDIWVSKWASDTLMRLTPSGALIEKFLIAGLTGVRSFTTDGTYLYAGTNSTTVYRINPSTKALAPPHITVANAARWITYDPTLNANAGGFWYGNYNIDINAISMSGTVLSTIPAATHGLTGMYGAAYDGVSPGGPYLWVFDQSGTNTSQVRALSLPSGTQTIYTRDAFVDLSTGLSLTSALAGGMFLSTTINTGNVALIGLIQGTPNNGFFAYDLDLSSSLIDAGVTNLRPTKGYTKIPARQIFNETFTFSVMNSGTVVLDSVYAEVEISRNGTPVNNHVYSATNVASAATVNFTTNPFTPSFGKGVYDVDVTIHLGSGQVDSDDSNDAMTFSFEVTDSLFARDNNIPDGGSGYAVSGTEWAYALTNFELNAADTLNGVWIKLANPVAGDTTYAVIAHTTGGIPDAVLATGTIVIINTDSVYFLEFTSPVILSPGLYSIGCYEGVISTINLAQSPSIFTTGMNFFYTPTNGWVASGIQTARFIRPYFKVGDSPIGMKEENDIASNISIYPNPASGKFTVNIPETDVNSVIKVYTMNGKLLEEIVSNFNEPSNQIDLGKYPDGMYFVNIQSARTNVTKKIVIAR